MISENEKVRDEILEILYLSRSPSIFESGKVERIKILESLPYNPEQIDQNINNLCLKKLVDLRIYNSLWETAEITDGGIKYYESKKKEIII